MFTTIEWSIWGGPLSFLMPSMPWWVRYLLVYWAHRWLKETRTPSFPSYLIGQAGSTIFPWVVPETPVELPNWSTSNWGPLKKIFWPTFKHSLQSILLLLNYTYRKIGFCQGSIKFYFQRPMLVNVGRIIKRPREWDSSISMSKIPVSTKCFPEVFGQAAAVVYHSTKLFHLQRQQAMSQPQEEPPPPPGLSLLFLPLSQYFTSLWFSSAMC